MLSLRFLSQLRNTISQTHLFHLGTVSALPPPPSLSLSVCVRGLANISNILYHIIRVGRDDGAEPRISSSRGKSIAYQFHFVERTKREAFYFAPLNCVLGCGMLTLLMLLWQISLFPRIFRHFLLHPPSTPSWVTGAPWCGMKWKFINLACQFGNLLELEKPLNPKRLLTRCADTTFNVARKFDIPSGANKDLGQLSDIYN